MVLFYLMMKLGFGLLIECVVGFIVWYLYLEEVGLLLIIIWLLGIFKFWFLFVFVFLCK